MATLRMHKTADAPARARTGSSRWGPRAQILGGVLVLAAVAVVAATAIGNGGSSSRSATIPAGTRLVAALGNTITTENGRVGQSFELRTTEPLTLAKATIPAGVVIRGEVTHTKGGGRLTGAPELTLRFTKLELDGREYAISADPFRLQGKSDTKETVGEIAGGAIVGGIVGAVAGDVAKGAVIGGVLGTGVAVATKGNQIVLAPGQRIRVRLTEPVSVRYSDSD